MSRVSKKGSDLPAPESVAGKFFNSHPEVAMDPRPAAEKVAAIEQSLAAGHIEDRDLFQLLIQKKCLCDLEFGSDSLDSIVAAVQLGALYNRLKRYDSANRHLKPAFDCSRVTQMAESDRFHLAVEFADSTLSVARQVADIAPAESALLPFAELKTANRELRYRRDVIIARMFKMRRKFRKALVFYQRAVLSFIWFRENQQELELADLYIEAAAVARERDQDQLAAEYIAKANAIYAIHGMQPVDAPLGTGDANSDGSSSF
jgi:tetratricopeptide (TPR) repeat protein